MDGLNREVNVRTSIPQTLKTAALCFSHSSESNPVHYNNFSTNLLNSSTAFPFAITTSSRSLCGFCVDNVRACPRQ